MKRCKPLDSTGLVCAGEASKPGAKPVRQPVVVRDGTVEIPLTRGFVAVVDEADYRSIPELQGRWIASTSRTGQVSAMSQIQLDRGRKKAILMHRLILGVAGRGHVRHLDGDSLNNRRSNLFELNRRNPSIEADQATQGVVRIPLGNGLFATVDAEDYQSIPELRRKWVARSARNGRVSAVRLLYERGGRVVTLMMHRVILGIEGRGHVRHRDGDGLNNTRDNLVEVAQDRQQEPRALGSGSADSPLVGGRRASGQAVSQSAAGPPAAEQPRSPESSRLWFGPYRMPWCRVGSGLECQATGETVVVEGVSEASIQWPYIKKRGRRSLILCGDLVKAVALESQVAVAHHWGVPVATVRNWRRSLGLSGVTFGTVKLRNHYLSTGRATSLSAESRAKMSASQRRRKLPASFFEAAREAARRPKSEAWRRKMSEVMKQQWASGRRRRAVSE